MSVQSKVLKIINGRIVRDGKIVVGEYLYVKDGKFIDGKSHFWEGRSTPDLVLDAKNAIIAPGYIDIQLNGAVGVDFTADCDMLAEGLDKVSKAILKWGCTAYCPTIVSSHPNVYSESMHLFAPRQGDVRNGAEILGAHLEGPFISPLKFGAHDVETLRVSPNGLSDFESCYNFKRGEKKNIALITVAPEMEGIMETIPELVDEDIIVSIGHSSATSAQAEKAIENGATLVTHMFNAMQQFHHRDPGIIGVLGSSKKKPYYGIICDGIHCHPNSVKIAYSSHPAGVVLVTDAMSAAGLPPGQYYLGNMTVDKSEDRVYIQGTTILAGSVITMDQCVKNFRSFTGCSIVEAIEAATLHPAQALNITHKKGTFNAGADADILFLDDELNVERVFVAGEEVVAN
ncbi:putative N-acetylglucosamine-6-phosphate deacetylase [Basidiobolus meristosporus CBS 931.73]|uniref:N-acetylglucosamine-6-phosphate deacetylase n=1 Tax=Basidiobolus meristosporus CBS 931.73 TaxID=1314790 RepID=A0A1Y1Z3W4_9FUNG|nr:putative N-acetylglucosamine-6-phosphate deacetylase [Basidiobolus meristosporus CBS 931.73]|eukprot:ORY04896.1 putative N-acetylglucosamine-6-phosphate deacetylase [Basidiobolus meristosporus CBS 931.73]